MKKRNIITFILILAISLIIGACSGGGALKDDLPPYTDFIEGEGRINFEVDENVTIDGKLDEIDLEFEDNAAVCVVLASDGYPVSYEKGFEIRGLEQFDGKDGYYVVHAGTKLDDGKIVTNGGRVLGVTATADTLEDAICDAYKAVSKVHFDNAFYRKDIGKKALAIK